MVYKTNESIIVIQAEAINPNKTDVVFWSHDRGTAKLRMKLVRNNGIPQSLPEGTTVPIRLMFTSSTAEGGYGKHDYLATIEDRVNGLVSIILEDNILGYVGTVEGSVYIDFPNDRSLDTAGRFSFAIKRSPIDDSTPELEDYYFNGFSQTIDQIEKILTDGKQEIEQKIAVSETQIDAKLKDTNDKLTKANQEVVTLNTNIDKANDRIDQTNQQISDLGKLKKMYSNSIDFGGYDYSGNPNLLPKIKASNFAQGNAGVTVKDREDGGIDFVLDGTTQFLRYNPTIPLPPLLEGETYTISAEIMFNSDLVGDLRNISLRVSFLPSGTSVLFNTRPLPDTSRNKWIKIKGSNVIDYTTVSSGRVSPDVFYLVFQDIVGSNKITGTISLRNLKVEKGSVATSYQPNLINEPYYMSKVPLGENIANKGVQFPIKTNEYRVYNYKNTEDFIIGQKYVLTVKATKPGTQIFNVRNTAGYTFGSMTPVEGLVNTWTLAFTPTTLDVNNPSTLEIYQVPDSSKGAVRIEWLKLEKGATRTPNIKQYKYFGESLKDSNNPKDYSWDMTPESIEKSFDNAVSLTDPETVLGLKNFAEGLQSGGINVAVEYAKAVDNGKYAKHGAIYLGGCVWLAWETLTFQKADGYAKGSYIRLGADGNASFTYSDVPNIFGGYLWLGGTCQPDYTDGGFNSYHITIENNFDDARKPIVRFIDSPTTPVKKLAVRGFALVFAPAPTENSQIRRQDDDERYLEV